jgi:hypothetical protein
MHILRHLVVLSDSSALHLVLLSVRLAVLLFECGHAVVMIPKKKKRSLFKLTPHVSFVRLCEIKGTEKEDDKKKNASDTQVERT